MKNRLRLTRRRRRGNDFLAGRRRHFFRPRLEVLEERALLAQGMLRVDQVEELLQSQQITGATIITHGFQFSDSGGDSLISLAQAVQARQGGWLLDYDIREAGGEGAFDFENAEFGSIEPPVGQSSNHVVLLFDWAPESNEPSAGWGEAAGDALFTLLIGLGLVDLNQPATRTTLPLHFIGHSFGAAVTSEAVERLAYFDVPVDQVTYLDPHDFAQAFLPYDDEQQLYELGLPEGYGATVWDNVSFADVYYETRGSNFLGGLLVPEGRPIPGAYNRLLDTELPALASNGAGGDHTYVWECFYRATVLNAPFAPGCPLPGVPDFATTGYAFSAKGVHSAGLRNDPVNFPNFGDGQDHEHSGGPVFADEEYAPLWEPSNAILNGDFSDGPVPSTIDPDTQQFIAPSLFLPGWSDHGGSGTGVVEALEPTADRYLRLSKDRASRTTNRFYLPDQSHLTFDHWITDPSNDDRLEVRIDDFVVGSYPLINSTSDFETQRILLSPTLNALLSETDPRRHVRTLTFAIQSLNGDVDSQVRIDNIQLHHDSSPPRVAFTVPTLLRPLQSDAVLTLTGAAEDGSGGNGVQRAKLFYRESAGINQSWSDWQVSAGEPAIERTGTITNIHASFAGKAGFQYDFRLAAADEAENVGYTPIRTGDIAAVDLGAFTSPVDPAFRITGFTLLGSAGQSQRIQHQTNPVRGDLVLSDNGKVVGHVIFSDRVDGQPFSDTGRFYLAPVGSSRVDLQACKLEYSIVSPK